MNECGKYAVAKPRLTAESRNLMEAGKLPLRREDLKLIPSTYYSFETTTNLVMGIFSKYMNRVVRMSDFFAFGKEELIEPEPNVADWFKKEVPSLTIR